MQWPGSSSSASEPRLLDAALLAALQGLTLPTRRARGALPGVHSGTQPGRGEDFFQHRAYVSGEDVRSVDWRASARTGHLLVKERHRPLRQPLALLLDRSASMQFAGKERCALQLAAGLALLALQRGDPVSLFALHERGFRAAGRALPAGRSGEAAELLVQRTPRAGRANLAAALSSLPGAALSGSHAVLVSDLYGDEEQLSSGLRALVRAGAAVSVLHVLSARERELPASAPALRDLETGEERAVTPGEELGPRIEAWLNRLRAAAARAGAELIPAAAESPAALTLRHWLHR